MSEETKEAPQPVAQEEKKGPSKKELKKQARAAEKEAKRAAHREAEAKEKGAQQQQQQAYVIPKLSVAEVATAKFGDLPLFQSQKEYRITPAQEDFVALKTAPAEEPCEVHVRAYLQSVRVTGKTVFAVLRQKVDTLQCVGFGDRELARYVASVPKESCVEVVGVVKKTPQPVSSCSIADRELEITRFFAVTRAQAQLPLQVLHGLGQRGLRHPQTLRSLPVIQRLG